MIPSFTDHVFGAEAFIDEGETPEIFAHETTMEYVYRIVSEYRPIITKRSFRMFGNLLDDEAMVNDGIGPFLTSCGGATGYNHVTIVWPAGTMRWGTLGELQVYSA